MTTNDSSRGGQANISGVVFEASVGAWLATHILAEKPTAELFGLPLNSVLDRIWFQAGAAVDDIIVATSNDDIALLNVKSSKNDISISGATVASALRQFVRFQIDEHAGHAEWDVAFHVEKYRLVLALPAEVADQEFGELARRLPFVPAPGQRLTDIGLGANGERFTHAVKKAWRDEAQVDPTESEVLRLLSRISIKLVAVQQGGNDLQNALEWLRAVTANGDFAGAWTALVEECTNFGKYGGGAAINDLRAKLRGRDVKLSVPSNIVSDIDKIRRHNTAILNYLRPLSYIAFDRQRIEIDRAVAGALEQASLQDSFLVIGESGSGKSGLLHWLADKKIAAGEDCVLIAVDDVDGGIQAAVGNISIRLEDLLDQWDGTAPGYLIIDALDAARFGPVQKQIRRLIQHMVVSNSRWRVIASIRKFDLRYGTEIQDMFAGSLNPNFADPTFPEVKHINVLPLTDDELGQLEQRSPPVWEAIQKVAPPLRRLIENPFHLRIFVELLRSNISIGDLATIASQTGLLSRYWSYRIDKPKNRIQLQACLSAITHEMVEKRAFRAGAVALQSQLANLQEALEDCLSANVLTDLDPHTGASDTLWYMYSHHMLFDFACGRLFVSSKELKSFAGEVGGNAELVLFLRPAISMHFSALWDMPKRDKFWQWAMSLIAEAGLPQIVKIIGPTIFGERVSRKEDFDTLRETLLNPATLEPARQFLRYALGVYFTYSESVADERTPLWVEFLSELAQALGFNFEIASVITNVLNHIARSDRLEANKEGLCIAGCRVLSVVLAQDRRIGQLMTQGIAVVANSFAGAPDEAEAVLGQLLTSPHLRAYGHEDLFWIANGIGIIAEARPEFATRVYQAAFSNEVDKDESISIGDSQIMPLTQSKKQAYELNWWSLSQKYPRFFKASPVEATKACLAVVKARVESKGRDLRSYNARLGSREIEIVIDHSCIWFQPNEEDRHSDNGDSILNHWLKGLVEIAQAGDAPTLRAIESLIAVDKQYSAMFAAYLRAAKEMPQMFALLALPLVCNGEVLLSSDLGYDAAEYIRAFHPEGDEAERAAIEAAVAELDALNYDAGQLKYARQRLIGCLKSELVSDVKILAELKSIAGDALPENQPRYRTRFTSRALGQNDYLTGLGVTPGETKNFALEALTKEAANLIRSYDGADATQKQKSATTEMAFKLWDQFRKDRGTADRPLITYSVGVLAALVRKITTWARASAPNETTKLLLDILLEAAEEMGSPEIDAESNEQFNTSLAWGWPCARMDAAEGLLTLCKHLKNDESQRAKDAIRVLARDGSATVRYGVASYLTSLYTHDYPLMWDLINDFVTNEDNRAVLDCVVSRTLSRLPKQDVSRVVPAISSILARVRVRGRSGGDVVREHGHQVLVDIYVWAGYVPARDELEAIFADVGNYTEEARTLAFRLRDLLTHDKEVGVRKRANEVYRRIAGPAIVCAEEVLASDNSEGTNSEEEIARKRSILLLADRIGTEFYFASGAYTDGKHHKEAPTELQIEWFVNNKDLVRGLLSLSLPSMMHYLIQLLEYFIPVAPTDVFDMLVHAYDSGRKRNYQFEQMGVEVCVRIIERYLAAHRDIFAGNPKAQADLVRILDIFIDAGWPEARRLAYRLSDIYS